MFRCSLEEERFKTGWGKWKKAEGSLVASWLRSVFSKKFLIDRQQWINSVNSVTDFLSNLSGVHVFCSVTLGGICKAIKTSS